MRVFVSYARQDANAVEGIKQAVEGIGHDIWFDRELKGGQQWWDTILEQIRSCDAFVFALSPNSAKSKACRLELMYAIGTQRALLPVMVGTVDARLFHEGLANYQNTDFRNASIASTLALVNALNRLPKAGPLPDPLPVAPPVPITYLDEFTIKLEAESLPLKEQRSMVAALGAYLDDEDDRPVALELLRQLRKRPDVIEAVAREIDRLTGAAPRPAEAPMHRAPVERSPVEVRTSQPGPSLQQPARAGTPPKTYRFTAPSVDIYTLAQRLENWLTSEQLQTQVLNDGATVLVQAQSAEKWKKWIGASVAFTISMRMEGFELVVEMGQAQWKDKAAAAAVGLFVAWPALIPAAFGAARQKALPEKALRLIERSLAEANTLSPSAG
ncbi:toll/interleukin-1 receptor domain-containing protein [Pyxidicoccus parkwayensis]|uniref:Toll/interleukin-1 receptor domain-containing protein n=1 Tax=Pyxidicoccus parkwayensis TaxID=2813578 RepID=A0ABX7P3X5_9BACT|nr:toll/interleukin-1 receptor domain-containing protein [Pyxidicoccus parkwaysis]QSQ25178.1 toll/interleukin-1 receptor domain-containing protein [Pyxidicoccus parkwaysis]